MKTLMHLNKWLMADTVVRPECMIIGNTLRFKF